MKNQLANAMINQIFMISIVVEAYDSAITQYTQDWGFELLEDSPFEEGRR